MFVPYQPNDVHLSGAVPAPAPGHLCSTVSRASGVFADVSLACEAAAAAQRVWAERPLQLREPVLDAIRAVGVAHATDLAERALQETGLGTVQGKVAKHLLAAQRTPGTELLRSAVALTAGDEGMGLLERSPYGVIAATAPSTGATELMINNSISMLAGGNAVVFLAHPGARHVAAYFVGLVNDAIVEAGGPANLVCVLSDPSMDAGRALFTHPLVRLVVATGGAKVVKLALESGKRAIAAGPGNPPVVVDETAVLEDAARCIVDGASFDNNVLCFCEKEVFAVDSIADRLKSELARQGAFEVTGAELERLVSRVLPGGRPARELVGRSVEEIARAADITVPSGTRLLLVEVAAEHPLVFAELMMPVLPFSRLPDVDACIAAARAAEQGFGHSAVIHSQRLDVVDRMARTLRTTLLVTNGPSYSGIGMTGEGYPSFTLASTTGEGITTAVTFTRERRRVIRGLRAV